MARHREGVTRRLMGRESRGAILQAGHSETKELLVHDALLTPVCKATVSRRERQCLEGKSITPQLSMPVQAALTLPDGSLFLMNYRSINRRSSLNNQGNWFITLALLLSSVILN